MGGIGFDPQAWGERSMKRIAILATALGVVIVMGLPFVGGGGPGITAPAIADSGRVVPALASVVPQVEKAEAPTTAAATVPAHINEIAVSAQAKADAAASTKDSEHLAQKAVPKPLPPVDSASAASGTNQRRAEVAARGSSCPAYGGSSNSGAPGITSAGGVGGTTTADLASFAAQYNAIRADNCLAPVARFVYDSCMEARLFWMAEDPSTNPASAWGHIGSVRSDGVPSVGCDGNLAGGSGNTGASVASKWWYSAAHQASLYRTSSSTAGVCIAFAMTHGGVPNEPSSFTRAAARWINC